MSRTTYQCPYLNGTTRTTLPSGGISNYLFASRSAALNQFQLIHFNVKLREVCGRTAGGIRARLCAENCGKNPVQCI